MEPTIGLEPMTCRLRIDSDMKTERAFSYLHGFQRPFWTPYPAFWATRWAPAFIASSDISFEVLYLQLPQLLHLFPVGLVGLSRPSVHRNVVCTSECLELALLIAST